MLTAGEESRKGLESQMRMFLCWYEPCGAHRFQGLFTLSRKGVREKRTLARCVGGNGTSKKALVELLETMTYFVGVNLETVVPYFLLHSTKGVFSRISRQKVMNPYRSKLLEVLFLHSTQLKMSSIS